MSPSLFLKEIPEDLLDIEEKKERLYFADEDDAYSKPNIFKKRTEITTKNTIKVAEDKKFVNTLGLKVGDKVSHKKFGLGSVQSINPKKIVVRFVDGERDIAMIIADKFLTKLS